MTLLGSFDVIITQANGSKARINHKSKPLNNCPKCSKNKAEKDCKADRSYKSSESIYILCVDRDDVSAGDPRVSSDD